MPPLFNEQAPVPPPAYQRAQARLDPALQIDALTLVRTLHLLTLCRLAVRLPHRRCPPLLPAGKGGVPRTYNEESLVLLALLRTLWRLSRPGIGATGCATGLPWPWPAACRWESTVSRASPAPLNSGSVDSELALPCPRSSLSSVC
jgi:hypothetical protein